MFLFSIYFYSADAHFIGIAHSDYAKNEVQSQEELV